MEQLMEFQTTDGAAYMVEGSNNGQTWTQIAGPLFGNGGLARALLPQRPSYTQRRVRVLNEASLLPGTSQWEGKSILLNDGGRPRQIIFFPTAQGVRRGMLKTDATHARSFTWKSSRQTAAESTVVLEYLDGTKSTLSLKFSTVQLGGYELHDQDPAGNFQVSEAGSFSLHEGQIQDMLSRVVLPTNIGGQQWMIEEGGALTRFDFGNDGTVTVNYPGGSTEKRNYQFARGTNPANGALKITSSNQTSPGLQYQVQMTTQGTGNTSRMPLPIPGQPLPPGTLPLPGNVNIPTARVITQSTTGPPSSLNGKTLQLNGNEPVTLTFHSDGTGTATREENGSVEVTPFIYNYSPTDDDEASLALIYPGAQTDRVEDYDLDFSANGSGSFRSSSFEGGELAQNSTGSFNTQSP